jgi:hypothetical protein
MLLTVWVDDWQLQCCGEAFRTRSRVTWRLVEPERDELEAMLSPQDAAAVTHREEHHDDGEGPLTSGSVESIRAVYCRMAPPPDRPRLFLPVPDSAVLVDVDSAEGYEPDRDELTFRGYLVSLRT